MTDKSELRELADALLEVHARWTVEREELTVHRKRAKACRTAEDELKALLLEKLRKVGRTSFVKGQIRARTKAISSTPSVKARWRAPCFRSLTCTRARSVELPQAPAW